jgi:mannose-1-phosphate guanylyltransferase/mannose-6-phosphate isomerase
MNNPHLYFVILAGGNGERLWPLSRQATPKQLLKVGTDTTLLEQAIDRIRPMAYSTDNIWISTTQQHAPLIEQIVKGRVGNIVIEPSARNTAPAILYCCHLLRARDEHAQVMFVPADAFIAHNDYDAFRHGVQQCIAWMSQHTSLVLCGVKPHYAATGYGYIEYELNDTSTVYRVTRFQEKPNRAVAQYYMQLPSMLWNIGMFGAAVTTFIDQCQQHAPDLFAAVACYVHGTLAYEQIPAISIDYALIEMAQDVHVVPMNISWCDIGNLSVLLSVQEASQNLISINARDNLTHAQGKLVVCIGVEKLCIVDTPDVLLITHADTAESVKTVVTQLKQQGSNHYL